MTKKKMIIGAVVIGFVAIGALSGTDGGDTTAAVEPTSKPVVTTPEPTVEPTESPEPTPTPTPEPTATPEPTPKPTATPEATRKPVPTATPVTEPAEVWFNSDDPYKQTWTKSYGKTTCKDWNTAMTREQRFAMSADMLTAVRTPAGLPFADDMMFIDFGDAISEGCLGLDVLKVGEVAATLWTMSDDFKN